MPSLKAGMVDVDPLFARSERAVDAMDTFEPKAQFTALPLDFRQPVRCPINVDQIDRHGLRELNGAFGECS